MKASRVMELEKIAGNIDDAELTWRCSNNQKKLGNLRSLRHLLKHTIKMKMGQSQYSSFYDYSNGGEKWRK